MILNLANMNVLKKFSVFMIWYVLCLPCIRAWS